MNDDHQKTREFLENCDRLDKLERAFWLLAKAAFAAIFFSSALEIVDDDPDFAAFFSLGALLMSVYVLLDIRDELRRKKGGAIPYACRGLMLAVLIALLLHIPVWLTFATHLASLLNGVAALLTFMALAMRLALYLTDLKKRKDQSAN